METFVTNYNPHCCRHCGNQMLSVIDCKLEDAEVRLKRLETWKDTVPELYLSIVDAEDEYLSKVDAEDIYLHTDDELYKLYIDTITRAMGGSSIEPITINGKTINTRDLLDANKDGVIGMGDIGSATLLRNYAYGAIIDYLMKHYGNSYYTQSQVDSAITEEARLRLLADGDLQDSINQLHNDLTAETQNRVAGDTNALSNANHHTDEQIASLKSSMNAEDVRLGSRIDSVNTDLQYAKNTSEAHYTELREWLSTIDGDYDHFEELIREAIARKADKVANATNGNFASLDENGNLVDSGHKHSDYQPAGNYKTKQTAKSSPSTSGNALEFIDTVSQDANGVITATKKKILYVSDSADGIITKDQKLYWDAKQPAGNYKTVQSAKANPTATDLDLTNHTFAFVDSISQNANGEISATSKKINTSAWDDAANKRHTHTNKAELDKIQTDDVQKWNKTTDDLKAIIDTPDEDSVINKWNEIIHFLETYTEADTLANLLRNKADKDEVAPKYLPLIQNYVKNIRQDANNQNKLTIELHNMLTDSEFEYNPTWSDRYTGTVTSVAMTVPTGLAVSGSPITTAGTLAVSFANGYSLPTTAKQNNWDTAYGWGNHANAGYAHTSDIPSLTNYVTTDSALNITAAKTFTSGASSSEQNVRIKNDGITFDSTIRGVQTKAELYISADGRLSVKNNAGNIVGTVAYYDEIPSAAKQTNWDTAYGWGNHANAGYATESYVDDAIDNLSPYYSESEIDQLFYNKSQINSMLNGYATTSVTDELQLSIDDLYSKIPGAITNYVTTDTAQNIIGTKTFLPQNTTTDKSKVVVDNTGITIRNAEPSLDPISHLTIYHDAKLTVNTNDRLLVNGNVVALLSEVPAAITNYVTTDTQQTITATKTFTGCRISIGNGGILDLNGNTMLIGTVSSTEGFADMATLSIQNGRPNIYTGGVGATLDGIRIATQNWVTSNFVSSSVLSDYVLASNPVLTGMLILNNANNNNGILFGGNMNNSYAAIVDDNTSMIFIHGSNNITLPNKSGTIALTSDLPTSADFVTPLQLSTTLLDYVHTNVNTENIYGTKIFSPYVPSGATTTDNSQATVKSSLIKLSSYINVSGGSKNVTEGQFISSELTIDKYTENSSGEQTGKVWHTAIDTNHIEFGWVDADTFDASFAGIYINDSSQLEIRGSLSAYNGIIATQNYVDNAIAEGNFISQNPSMISFPYTDTSEVGEPTHYVELTSGMYSSTGGGLYANNNRLAFASEVDALTQSMVDALDDLDARVTALENRN